MFEPHIEKISSGGAPNRNVKRPATSIHSDRRVRKKTIEIDFAAARAAGRAASGPGYGDSWYQDLMDYSEGINNEVRSMIQESRENIKRGDHSSSQDTICQLAEYRLCQEIDSFMLSCPESAEVKSGLNKSLKYAVDRGDPGMTAYLIAVGADPLRETGGFNSLTLAMAADDGSFRRQKVLSVIEESLGERLGSNE